MSGVRGDFHILFCHSRQIQADADFAVRFRDTQPESPIRMKSVSAFNVLPGGSEWINHRMSGNLIVHCDVLLSELTNRTQHPHDASLLTMSKPQTNAVPMIHE
jgi:hypothetical protein